MDGYQVSELDGFLCDHQRIWLGVAGRDLVEQPIGIGLKPVHGRRLFAPSTVGGQKRARPALENVEACVSRNTVEPCSDHGASLEPSPGPPCPQECLLHQVFGLIE